MEDYTGIVSISLTSGLDIYGLSPFICRRVHVLFKLFVFACMLWCQTYILLCFCFVCLRLVSCVSKLPVSLDYPYLIATSVFYSVYLLYLVSK